MNLRDHWEEVYLTKTSDQMSWSQVVPETSLRLINAVVEDRSLPVIDIGGGDSLLADYLLDQGFTDITVLDISEAAINRAKQRLGSRAENIHWIVSDILEFQPDRKYHTAHDRAAFHFLTSEEDRLAYRRWAEKYLNGYLILGTFSEYGPMKCSMLPVHRYSELEISRFFGRSFDKINCFHLDHQTPFGSTQNFLFCTFKKTIRSFEPQIAG